MSQEDQGRSDFQPIAIVGVSAIFPGDGETEGFWRDIVAGRDLVREIPSDYWKIDEYFDSDPKAPDKVYAKRGAFLSGIPFDTLGFGIQPQILAETDSAQLLALVAAKRVLDEVERAGKVDRNRASVILGVTAAQKLAVEMNARIQRPRWAEAMREAGLAEEQVQKICDRISANYVPWRENTFPGLLGNVVAGRVANRLNLGGTNCVTDAACASSFAAISMAIQELHLGHSDLALTGGVDTFNDPFMYMCFSKTPALSATGDCRPFSDQADGTILGEGVGMFALKRLKDAERDGNTIYAVIRGLGTSSDGRAKSVYAPLPEGQARALRRAYQGAGYGPETVELVEAHGTGTVAGDQAEFEGLRQVFEGTGRKDRQWCALGTVKSQIGHTKAAAGAAGLYKAAMALHHKILPPTIKVSKPHPKFGLEDSPFYLNTRARPWIRGGEHPRRASVSSFGFGGSNFHLALEEHRPEDEIAFRRKAGRIRAQSSELVVFSAAEPADLLKACREALETASLRALARRGQQEFDARAKARLAVVARDEAALKESLSLAIARIEKDPLRAFELPTGVYYSAAQPEPGKVAFLFSGQGSQSLEMGAELAMSWDQARAVWDEAAELKWDGTKRLDEVVFPRPAFADESQELQRAELTETRWAQPAIGAASLAQLSLLRSLGLRADCVGGHSFGELTALCAAGALSGKDLLKAARKRGELMGQAAATRPEAGGMLAVVSPAEPLASLLRELAPSDVTVANANSPRETVLAGSERGLAQVEKALGERAIPSQRLKVATAFHSPWVEAAVSPFEEFLGQLEWRSPALPVYSNLGGKLFASGRAEIVAQLARQIRRPVEFVAAIEAMISAGVRTFVEVGPSTVLTRLVGEILGDRPHLAVALGQRGREACTPFWRGLGKLSVAGVKLDFSALWGEYGAETELGKDSSAARAQAMPAYKISGANYGKPKPEPLKPQGITPSVSTAEKTTGKTTVMREENENQGSEIAGLLGAFAEIHRSTAEAHAAYQRAMAESHAAFLRASEETLGRLAGYVSGAPVSAQRISLPRQPARPQPQIAPQMTPQAPARPQQASVPQPQTFPAPKPAPQPAVVAKPAVLQASVAQPKAVAQDFRSALFEVVAEKTGYPAEMLKLEMELEADLGIDSIKRVEILSALKKRVPSLASATAQETASMRSLEQIVAFTEKKSAQSGPQPSLM